MAYNTAPRFIGADLDRDRDVEAGDKNTAVSSGVDLPKDGEEQPAIPEWTPAAKPEKEENDAPQQRITFDATAEKDSHPKNDTALYIPGPRDREKGHPLVEVDKDYSESQDGKSIWIVV